jgi:hypothetical protein
MCSFHSSDQDITTELKGEAAFTSGDDLALRVTENEQNIGGTQLAIILYFFIEKSYYTWQWRNVIAWRNYLGGDAAS